MGNFGAAPELEQEDELESEQESAPVLKQKSERAMGREPAWAEEGEDVVGKRSWAVAAREVSVGDGSAGLGVDNFEGRGRGPGKSRAGPCRDGFYRVRGRGHHRGRAGPMQCRQGGAARIFRLGPTAGRVSFAWGPWLTRFDSGGRFSSLVVGWADGRCKELVDG